jgi:hypothetical protein
MHPLSGSKHKAREFIDFPPTPIGGMGMRTRANKVVILVVEDEPIVLMVAADSPEQAGLKVLEAEDAEAAVNILEV